MWTVKFSSQTSCQHKHDTPLHFKTYPLYIFVCTSAELKGYVKCKNITHKIKCLQQRMQHAPESCAVCATRLKCDVNVVIHRYILIQLCTSCMHSACMKKIKYAYMQTVCIIYTHCLSCCNVAKSSVLC